MDDGFNRVDEDLRALRSDVGNRLNSLESRLDARFDAQDGRFHAQDGRFDSLEGRLDALQRTMIQIGGGMIATMLVTFVSVILTRG